MNYNHRLVSNFIKKQITNRPIKNILTISKTPQIFENIPTEIFKEHNFSKLPFPNGTFDFVYVNEPLEFFSEPSHMYSELMRVCKSGLIQNISPICILLKKTNPKFVCWSETFSNTLCFMPHYVKIDIMEHQNIDRLCLHKPYYLYDWYSWDSNQDFNIRIYSKNLHFEDFADYELIFQNAVEESMKNTLTNIKN